jgi:aryl-alcohol dehydrogenase
MLTDALVVTEAGAPFDLQSINVDDNIRDHEALIEMKATGVCHTDLNFRREQSMPGLFPAVFGHEGEDERSIVTSFGPLLVYFFCSSIPRIWGTSYNVLQVGST